MTRSLDYSNRIKLRSLLLEKEKRSLKNNELAQYSEDPIGFCENYFLEEYTDDVKLVMESVRDNIVTVAKSGNATGKTHAAARIAAWFFKTKPESQVYMAAAPPENNLKRLLWGELEGLTQKYPNVFSSESISSLFLQQTAQHFIQGVTVPSSGSDAQREAKFSGKHAPNLLFILDEADAIPDEVFKGIESCMSGGHARLLILFNPRAESGEVYRMIRDRRAHVVELTAFTHPNVISGEDIHSGAVTRDVTVRRINEWARPLTGDEIKGTDCFELPDFLIGATAISKTGETFEPLNEGLYKVINPSFSYMVLGQYPAQGDHQLISKEWVAKARTRWDLYVSKYGEVPPAETYGIQGQDVADFGIDYNVSCFRYGGYVERLIKWNGIDTVETTERAAHEYERRKISMINVDATGVGAGVAPGLQRLGCPGVRVMVASSPTFSVEEGEFGITRDQIMWSVREWLRADNSAMLPPDEELIEELSIPSYEIRGGKIKVMQKDDMKKKLGRSPDCFDALALTFASEIQGAKVNFL